MNMSKSSSYYSDLLTHFDLEHLRYSHALTHFYKPMYNVGPINIKEVFIIHNVHTVFHNEYDLRDLNKLLQLA